ncbi:MAG: DUF4330 family protein [Candidatus Microgenomates bacterium]|jgi:hypothetical protein
MKHITIFKRKVTYFDFILGGVFIIVMLGVFLFLYRKNEYVNIRVKVTDQDVLYASTDPKSWYANRFEVGDIELDELGRTISQITGVETFNMSPDTKAVYLDIKIKAVYDRRTKLYSARGINLTFGNTIRFNFSNASFYALITESPGTLNQKDLTVEEKEITVLERGPALNSSADSIEPEVLEKIKKGDEITDSNGDTLAEVENVVLRPGQRVVQNAAGNLLLRYDPYYKDAIITLKIRVEKYKGDEFVFDNVPLKLGSYLPLNFTYESIWPVITDIK